jgi:hypothetical protein
MTQCYVEIGYWSAAEEQAALWVKVPNVSSTIDTILYLYYDHTQNDNNAYVGDTGSVAAQNDWDENYLYVLHLDEVANGTAGEYVDSASHGNNGQGGGGNAAQVPTQVTSPIGK